MGYVHVFMEVMETPAPCCSWSRDRVAACPLDAIHYWRELACEAQLDWTVARQELITSYADKSKPQNILDLQ